MTVALCGVGLDSDNASYTKWEVPPRHSDGTFDYIPIPETEPTIEEETFGTWRLDNLSESRGEDVVASDILSSITPNDEIGTIIKDESIRNHRIHRDPNFEALTYGDKYGSDGQLLVNPEPDIVAFYTALEITVSSGATRKRRFLIGYFTVDEIVDLRGLDLESYREKLRRYPENAHAKRLLKTGSAKHEGFDDDGKPNEDRALIIVNGTTPAKLFDTPIPISRFIGKHDDEDGQGYYLTDEFMNDFNVADESGWVSIKRGLRLDIGPEEFISTVKDWRQALDS